MNKWTSGSIRKGFLDFFVNNHSHKLIKSSPVISTDPSLLFINSGMVQFKNIFINNDMPDSFKGIKRAVTSQKCIRTGGKHNDLDIVGHDFTHHTFFEMLGNWSFNSYFKKEAYSMALELITKIFKLNKDRLVISYFAGDTKLSIPEDIESKEIWLSLGIQKERILPLGFKDNFWEMGEYGPCGVCSEIHYEFDKNLLLEIWNIVSIQYNKDIFGNLNQLSAKHIDTGMGLERMTAILNGVKSNYNTDLFQPLLSTISEMTNLTPYRGLLEDNLDVSYRVVADHSRMIAVSLADGLEPGTKDAGRHFRKIFRNAFIRILYDFNYDTPQKILIELTKKVGDNLGDAYPEIRDKMENIINVINQESLLAAQIVGKATKMFDKLADQLDAKKQSLIPGDVVFDLFLNGGASTFMIEKMARRRNLKIDLEGFEKCFEKHKEKSADGLRLKRNQNT